jgi:hypothetical protein
MPFSRFAVAQRHGATRGGVGRGAFEIELDVEMNPSRGLFDV